jgi:hypothetical protein
MVFLSEMSARDVKTPQNWVVRLLVVYRTCSLILYSTLALYRVIGRLDTHSASSASPPQSWWGVSACHIKTSPAAALFDLLRNVDHLASNITLTV